MKGTDNTKSSFALYLHAGIQFSAFVGFSVVSTARVGLNVGSSDGFSIGVSATGRPFFEGCGEGLFVGSPVGLLVGLFVGTLVPDPGSLLWI